MFEFSKQDAADRDHGFNVGLEVFLQLSMGKRESRTMARRCLCDLLEQNVLPTEALNATVRMLFEKLSSFNHAENVTELEARDVLRSEILMVMVDVASFVGPEFCNEVMIPQLPDLCAHDSFIVRKNCPAAVAELCRIFHTSPEYKALIQSNLAPLYQQFIEDDIWGVRSAAAEHLYILSEGMSMAVRRETGTAWFCKLAEDNSRWVRCSAYKNLGRFIATFAPPISEDGLAKMFEESVATPLNTTPTQPALSLDGVTGTASSSDPSLNSVTKVAVSLDDVTAESSSTDPLGVNATDSAAETPDSLSLDCARSPESRKRLPNAQPTDSVTLPLSNSKDSNTTESVTEDMPSSHAQGGVQYDEEEEEYNNFEYWRQPLPDILDELAFLVVGAPATTEVSTAAEDSSAGAVDTAASVEDASKNAADTAEDATATDSVQPMPVPEALVAHFNKMADASSTKLIDDEAARNCAYSIPAILWALGKQNWHCIRETYLALAVNDDWRVRSTISHSIHICAQILGREIAEADLLPKFKTFVEDWDEVCVWAACCNPFSVLRISVLRNQFRFLPCSPMASDAPSFRKIAFVNENHLFTKTYFSYMPPHPSLLPSPPVCVLAPGSYRGVETFQRLRWSYFAIHADAVSGIARRPQAGLSTHLPVLRTPLFLTMSSCNVLIVCTRISVRRCLHLLVCLC